MKMLLTTIPRGIALRLMCEHEIDDCKDAHGPEILSHICPLGMTAVVPVIVLTNALLTNVVFVTVFYGAFPVSVSLPLA